MDTRTRPALTPTVRSHLRSTAALVIGCWIGIAWSTPSLAVAEPVMSAPTIAGDDVDHPVFLRAYYLEHEAGDFARARDLYARVAADRSVDPALRHLADVRRASCQEEVVSADFARLMRPETLAYFEFNRPGEQLMKLARQLGLLKSDDPAALGQQVGISAVLFRELLGIRGFAIGISGFDPVKQAPSGLAVAHPGNIEIVRGLLDTALPFVSKATEPIEGYPTYLVHDHAFVTLTHRLIFVSAQRGAIRNAVGRLNDGGEGSLADTESFAHALAGRDDALVHFVINFKRVLPLAMPFLSMSAKHDPGAAVALAALDLKSLHFASGTFGISDDGLGGSLTLKLDEGHQNLVFDLLRMPSIDREVLSSVPAGAAAVFAAALNDRRTVAPSDANGSEHVALMDFGREIFANIAGIAIFGVDGAGQVVDGEKVPSIGITITSNDPDKTLALWRRLLGFGAAAARPGAGLDGQSVTIHGVDARQYAFPEGVNLFLARHQNCVMLSFGQNALTQALACRTQSQPSIFHDAAFQRQLDGLAQSCTLLALARPKRLLDLAKPLMSRHERADIEPFLPLLEATTVKFGIEYSSQHVRLFGAASGLPEVGPMIVELIRARGMRQQQEMERASQRHRRIEHTPPKARATITPRRERL